MKKIFKPIAIAAITAISISSFGQGSDQNNGAECGCPTPVSSRPTIDLATFGVAVGTLNNMIQLNGSTHLTCANTYIFSKKIVGNIQ